MKIEQAIDIVARQLMRNAVEEIQWEDMPDVGQYDYEAVSERALFLAPQQEQWDEAIAMLEARAER